MATKVRMRGWYAEFNKMKSCLEQLILGTPTSELRNKLTDLNIHVMELETFDKEQKEVL